MRDKYYVFNGFIAVLREPAPMDFNITINPATESLIDKLKKLGYSNFVPTTYQPLLEIVTDDQLINGDYDFITKECKYSGIVTKYMSESPKYRFRPNSYDIVDCKVKHADVKVLKVARKALLLDKHLERMEWPICLRMDTIKDLLNVTDEELPIMTDSKQMRAVMDKYNLSYFSNGGITVDDIVSSTWDEAEHNRNLVEVIGIDSHVERLAKRINVNDYIMPANEIYDLDTRRVKDGVYVDFDPFEFSISFD